MKLAAAVASVNHIEVQYCYSELKKEIICQQPSAICSDEHLSTSTDVIMFRTESILSSALWFNTDAVCVCKKIIILTVQFTEHSLSVPYASSKPVLSHWRNQSL